MTGDLPTLGKLDVGDAYKLDLDYFLTCDYSDIGQAAAELPAVIEYVNARLQAMLELRITRKHKIKEVEGAAYMRLKGGDYMALYGTGFTERSLEHAIAIDRAVVAAYDDYAVIAAWCLRMQNLINSLSQKLDMVRSAEATRRSINDGDGPDDDDL